jgi:hypothetical protein
MPPLAKNPDKERETEIEAGWKCTVCNNLSTVIDMSNINLEYYLIQIKKVINAIENRNTAKSIGEDITE